MTKDARQVTDRSAAELALGAFIIKADGRNVAARDPYYDVGLTWNSRYSS